jgi:hypothetical protein
MTNEERFSKEISQKVKRAYKRPDLVVYGNIREITKSVGKVGGMSDNSMGQNDKTA